MEKAFPEAVTQAVVLLGVADLFGMILEGTTDLIGVIVSTMFEMTVEMIGAMFEMTVDGSEPEEWLSVSH